jgi:hypothetical protein
MSYLVERGEEQERRVNALSGDGAYRAEMSAGFAEIMRSLGKPRATPQNTPVSPADRPSNFIPMATKVPTSRMGRY